MRYTHLYIYMYVCIRYISPLWQPLTYFLLYVLPYNSDANIITYSDKSDVEGKVTRKDKTLAEEDKK